VPAFDDENNALGAGWTKWHAMGNYGGVGGKNPRELFQWFCDCFTAQHLGYEAFAAEVKAIWNNRLAEECPSDALMDAAWKAYEGNLNSSRFLGATASGDTISPATSIGRTVKTTGGAGTIRSVGPHADLIFGVWVAVKGLGTLHPAGPYNYVGGVRLPEEANAVTLFRADTVRFLVCIDCGATDHATKKNKLCPLFRKRKQPASGFK
jgi:hypothetical protein